LFTVWIQSELGLTMWVQSELGFLRWVSVKFI